MDKYNKKARSYDTLFPTTASNDDKNRSYKFKQKVPTIGRDRDNSQLKCGTPELRTKPGPTYDQLPVTSRSSDRLTSKSSSHECLKDKSSPNSLNDCKGSGFEAAAFKSFSSQVPPESSDDDSYQDEQSGDENLPGARRHRNRFAVADCSGDCSERSVSRMHSVSDLNSYFSDTNQRDDNSKDPEAAVDVMIDGVSQLQVNGRENSPSPTSNNAVSVDSSGVEADKDKASRTFLPHARRYYMHDHRNLNGDVEVVRKRQSNQRWKHDKFNYRDQCPLSTKEIVWKYGYDIRKEKHPSNPNKIESGGSEPSKSTSNIPVNSDKNCNAERLSSSRTDDKQNGNKPDTGPHCDKVTITRDKRVKFSILRESRNRRFTIISHYRGNAVYQQKDMSMGLPQNLLSRNKPVLSTNHAASKSIVVSDPPIQDKNTKQMHSQPPKSSENQTLRSNSLQNSSIPCSGRSCHSTVPRRNLENLSRSQVADFERTREKKLATVNSLHTSSSSLKPRTRYNADHIDQQEKTSERIPKRYSSVRQDVTSVNSSVDKNNRPSNPENDASAKKTDCISKGTHIETVTENASAKSSHMPRETTENTNQTPTDMVSNTSVAQGEVQCEAVSFPLQSVPVTHYQQTLQYRQPIPVQYPTINPQLRTVYLSDVLQHDAQFQPPNPMISNYMLPNTQPQVHNVYASQMQNINFPVPVATTICFDGVPCGISSKYPKLETNFSGFP
ncbi:unnamed protein product [Trichobilharzia regenti]|uniref:Protein CASC3 n=1 Tax=Trichobilharzia regenti TaxID=157069 RepID=A0A183VJ71_TRIRE|nr:unnamed protein product [Trichobilharzia regenti]VDP95189.1 unnamed protein product [Trichobilharzia regenti]